MMTLIESRWIYRALARMWGGGVLHMGVREMTVGLGWVTGITAAGEATGVVHKVRDAPLTHRVYA